MKEYLNTLHKRPDHHKKRFALITSGTFTLLIFAIWALATFGNDSSVKDNTAAAANANPFGPIMRGVQAGFDIFNNGKDELKQNLEVVNYQAGLNEINNYGQ